MKLRRPFLIEKNSLISADERAQWRDALSLHLLENMRSQSGFALSDWKKEEQVLPMNMAIAGLLARGITDLEAIEEHFIEGVIRREYVVSK